VRHFDEVIDEVARERSRPRPPRLRIEFVQILSDSSNDLAGAAGPVEIKLFGRISRRSKRTRAAWRRRSIPSRTRGLYNGVSEPAAEMLVRVNGPERRASA